MVDNQKLKFILHFSFVLLSVTQLTASPVANADEYAALHSFSLDQTGEHIFHFRQPRNGRVTLLLKVEGASGELDRDQLTGLRTTIEATLIDHTGRSICRASGTLKNGISADSWTLSTSAHAAAFWHRSCAEVNLKRSEAYTLKVIVRDVDPSRAQVRLMPVFESSDNYLP